MKAVPVAQLRMRQMQWHIDLTYTFPNRVKQFTVGPMAWREANDKYLEGDKLGRWIKEGIGDR